MKKYKFPILFLIAVIFVLVPLPATDMNVRLHFWEAQGYNCALYYTTVSSPDYSADKCINAEIDYQTRQVTFPLDASLHDQITGIRLDFPQTDAVISIDKITLSSAGIIQKQYNPCHFFAPENIVHINQADHSVVFPSNRVYIAPLGSDPFFVFTESLSSEFNDGFSHLHLTRLGIVLFLTACYFFYKKNYFSASNSR